MYLRHSGDGLVPAWHYSEPNTCVKSQTWWQPSTVKKQKDMQLFGIR